MRKTNESKRASCARVAPVVLAAGASRRMGAANKLLLPFRGEPLVRHAVRAARTSTGRGVLVVTGHQRRRVEAALRGVPALRFVHNPRHEDGMAASLRCGVAATPTTAGGYLICLGDQPRVTARALRALRDCFRSTPAANAIVTFAGVPGPPVLFGRGHHDALLQLADGDTGARALLREHAQQVRRVAPGVAGLSAEALADDVDTPAAYRRLCSEQRGGER